MYIHIYIYIFMSANMHKTFMHIFTFKQTYVTCAYCILYAFRHILTSAHIHICPSTYLHIYTTSIICNLAIPLIMFIDVYTWWCSPKLYIQWHHQKLTYTSSISINRICIYSSPSYLLMALHFNPYLLVIFCLKTGRAPNCVESPKKNANKSFFSNDQGMNLWCRTFMPMLILSALIHPMRCPREHILLACFWICLWTLTMPPESCTVPSLNSGILTMPMPLESPIFSRPPMWPLGHGFWI